VGGGGWGGELDDLGEVVTGVDLLTGNGSLPARTLFSICVIITTLSLPPENRSTGRFELGELPEGGGSYSDSSRQDERSGAASFASFRGQAFRCSGTRGPAVQSAFHLAGRTNDPNGGLRRGATGRWQGQQPIDG